MFLRRRLIRRGAIGASATGRNGLCGGRGGAYFAGTPETKSAAYCSVSRVSIEGRTEDNGVVFFIISVKVFENIEWKVFRRYSAFLELYDKIKYFTTIRFDSPFPSKQYSSWFSKMEEEELATRQIALQNWLIECVSLATENHKRSNETRVSSKDRHQLVKHLEDFLEVSSMLSRTLLQQQKIPDAPHQMNEVDDHDDDPELQEHMNKV